jgi:hypothetical protein
MSSHLEQFVSDHRDEFDDESPAPELWDKIRDNMQSREGKPGDKKQEAVMRSLPLKRWLSAVAAAAVVCVSGWLYFASHRQSVHQPVAINTPATAPDTDQQVKSNPAPEIASTIPQESVQIGKDGIKKTSPEKTDDAGGSPQTGYSEEMYYYSKLIEIKHNELKTLQKDEPLLYKKFSGDVNKLDSVYQTLKTQLPSNPNREQLIEAMIYNLRLQIGLLNKQLDVIKQIKHSKKSAYEKAYKSV